MSYPALSLLEPGSEISAASNAVFFSNTAANDQLMLPSSGIYPGWTCDVILADGATNIQIKAGPSQSINGGTMGGASTDKGAMITVTALNLGLFVAQKTETTGTIGAASPSA